MHEPSDFEQYMLELVNLARAYPELAALQAGVVDGSGQPDLNKDLAPGTISPFAKQPLAFNLDLIEASRAHSDWMLSSNMFDHIGSGGSNPGARMSAAGYSFAGGGGWGENISRKGIFPTEISQALQEAYTEDQHFGLIDSEGHRENIMDPDFREIGIGNRVGDFFNNGTNWNTVMITQNFAYAGSNRFFTGVVYDDTDGDDFYSPANNNSGEGRGGVNISVSGGSGGQTWDSGGFSIPAPGSGSRTVTFSGGGLSGSKTVTAQFGSQNTKIDLIDGDTIQTSVGVTLGSGVLNVIHYGVFGGSSTGNSSDNRMDGGDNQDTLVGGGGDDTLEGAGGNDELEGGAGNDSISGGSGSADRAVFNLASSEFDATFSGGKITLVGEGTDIIESDVEFLEFTNETLTFAEAQNLENGGGGGEPPNEPPTGFTLSTAPEVIENAAPGTLIATLTAQDPDAGDTHEFDIVAPQSDPTHTFFEIVGNQLRVANGADLDYEDDTSHQITIAVEDQDGASTTQQVTIQVENMAISDIELYSGGDVDEDAAANTTVAQFRAYENPIEPAATLTLTDDAGGRFYLSGGNLRVSPGASFDHSSNPSHTVTISATDGTGPAHQENFTIDVIAPPPPPPPNDPPTGFTVSGPLQIAENSAFGTVIASFTAQDPDHSSGFDFDILHSSSTNGSREFEFVGNELRVDNNPDVDFEEFSSVDLMVRVTDPLGGQYQELVTLQILNQAISDIQMEGGTIGEGAGPSTGVAEFEAFEGGEQEPAATYTLDDDAGGLFELLGDTLRVASGVTLGPGDVGTQTVTVSADDGTGPARTESFQITVTAAPPDNFAPTGLSLSGPAAVSENAAAGTVIAVLDGIDPDVGDVHGFAIVAAQSDPTHGFFSIVGDQLRVAAGADLDFEDDTSHDLAIEVRDQDGLAVVETVTVSVTNMAISDIAMESGGEIDEDDGAGTVAAVFGAYENPLEPTATFALVDSADGRFTLDGATLKVANGAVFSPGQVSVTVSATDGTGPAYQESFLIDVTGDSGGGGGIDPPGNAPPTGLLLSNAAQVSENAAPGTVIATLSAIDPDVGDSHSFAVTGGASASLFQVVGDALQVAPGAVLDFEDQTTHSIVVSVEDQDGGFHAGGVNIQVLNQAISDITLAGGALEVDVNAGVGTLVAVFEAHENPVEPEATLTLVDDADGRFSLSNNNLFVVLNDAFDLASPSHTVVISATDGTGPAYQESFSIQVTGEDTTPGGGDDTGGGGDDTGGGGDDTTPGDDTGGGGDDTGGGGDDTGGGGDDTGPGGDDTIPGGEPDEQYELPENALPGTVVAIYPPVTGPGGEVDREYRVSGGPDAAKFVFVGNLLQVAPGAVIDFEEDPQLSIAVDILTPEGVLLLRLDNVVIDLIDEAGTTHFGTSADEEITGTEEEDTLSGLDGGDTILGAGGNDWVEGGTGDDMLMGGPGDDTLVGGDHDEKGDMAHYDTPRAGFSNVLKPDGSVEIHGPGGEMDLLMEIERIDFADGDYIFDIDSPNRDHGYMLYSAAFARIPDGPGVKFWIDILDSGEFTDLEIAQFFIDSPEFALRYGADLTPTQYVNALYNNVLLRNADQEGFDFWLGHFAAGTLSEADMLDFFARSDENVARNAQNLENGVWVMNPEDDPLAI